MTPLDVARQTWEWIVGSGRVSGLTIQKVAEMGEDNFLQLAADRWELAGSRRYMDGMKNVMKEILYADVERVD